MENDAMTNGTISKFDQTLDKVVERAKYIKSKEEFIENININYRDLYRNQDMSPVEYEDVPKKFDPSNYHPIEELNILINAVKRGVSELGVIDRSEEDFESKLNSIYDLLDGHIFDWVKKQLEAHDVDYRIDHWKYPGLKQDFVGDTPGYKRSECKKHMPEKDFDSLMSWMYGQTVIAVPGSEPVDILIYAWDFDRWVGGLPVID